MTVNGGDWVLSIMTGIRPCIFRSASCSSNRANGKEQTIRVQAKEPILLLLIGHDVYQRRRPLRIVDILQFFKKNLNFLTVRRTLSNQMESLETTSVHIRIEIEIGIFNLPWHP